MPLTISTRHEAAHQLEQARLVLRNGIHDHAEEGSELGIALAVDEVMGAVSGFLESRPVVSALSAGAGASERGDGHDDAGHRHVEAPADIDAGTVAVGRGQ